MSLLSGKRLVLLFGLLVLVAVVAWLFLNRSNLTKTTSQSAFQPNNTNNNKVVNRDPKIHADKTEQFRIEYGKIRTLLPYEAGDVRLNYDEALGFITARIKDVKTEEDFLAKKLTMENFLKSKGVDDLCGLAITWFPPQGLTLPIKDNLSPNCTF